MGIFGTVSQFQDQQVRAEGLHLKPLSLTAATHTLTAKEDGRTIRFDSAAGTAVTLPAATGSGIRYRFVVGVTVTSNADTIDCAGTDEFAGVVFTIDTDTSDTVAAYPVLAADDADGVSMNGTTTGGRQGDWIEVEDIASGVWSVFGFVKASGAVAAPIS